MSRSNGYVHSQERTVPQADSCACFAHPGRSGAVCQLNSNTASVALKATLGESLTVAATPSTVTIPLVSGGTATGTSPVAITTTWVLSATRTAVTLVGYFSSATAALTDGAATPANIPASEVLGQVTTGTPTSFTAFTQTAPSGHGWSRPDSVYSGAFRNQPNRQPDRQPEPRNQPGRPTPATRRYLYGHAEYTSASAVISAQE